MNTAIAEAVCMARAMKLAVEAGRRPIAPGAWRRANTPIPAVLWRA
jgi:thiazole synthase ThiGH ThiG subunit